MPLVLDPTSHSAESLEQLRRSLRDDLAETVEYVQNPGGAVVDPASIETASDLLRSALAVLDRSGPRTSEQSAAEANLAYATMLAVIDLVKSHTSVPRVPRGRQKKG
jgi:hypothetical protein